MKLFPLCLTLALCLAAASAQAQPRTARSLGASGQLAVGVDRLFGFNYTTGEGRDGTTTLGLLGGTGCSAVVSPYSIPRLGFDYFVFDGFSLGIAGQLAITSHDDDSTTIIGFQPRLGYAIAVTPGFSIWPRGGLNYITVNGERDNDAHYMLALNAELMMVASPAPHFGFTFGPTADVGIAATHDSKTSQYGLQAGIIGWF